ncbi:MAG: hypothetical protein LC808_03740 [Actinobacteria bacterium]|nr:hypothetical protein [Actinomycetota bacterium]
MLRNTESSNTVLRPFRCNVFLIPLDPTQDPFRRDPDLAHAAGLMLVAYCDWLDSFTAPEDRWEGEGLSPLGFLGADEDVTTSVIASYSTSHWRVLVLRIVDDDDESFTDWNDTITGYFTQEPDYSEFRELFCEADNSHVPTALMTSTALINCGPYRANDPKVSTWEWLRRTARGF